jgi:hypothetical protein
VLREPGLEFGNALQQPVPLLGACRALISEIGKHLVEPRLGPI